VKTKSGVNRKGGAGITTKALRVFVLGSLLAGVLAGCGGGGTNDGPTLPAYPGRVEFTILPGNGGAADKYYIAAGGTIANSTASQLTHSDLLQYGQTQFAAYDPAAQDINPAFVSGNGRYAVTALSTSNGGLTFTITDALNHDNTVTVVTAPAVGLSPDAVMGAISRSISNQAAAQALANAISATSSNR
jgi:hypothetical protein